MKKIVLILLIIGSGCSQRLPYYAPDNYELHKFSREFFISFNGIAECDFLRYTNKSDRIINIYEEELEGNVIGYWDGDITLDPYLKHDDTGWDNDFAKNTLLHEVGHSLGYGHVDDPCHVMYKSQNNCNGEPEAFEEFVKQIIEERGC